MIRAFQWDLGRQIERLDFLLQWIPRYADWGYQQIHLYLEDAFDFPSTPGIGRHRALTAKQMDRLTAEATRRGMQVVPIVPLLGHTSYLLNVDSLRKLSEKRDPSGNPLNSGQICPLHKDTLTLARNLIKDVQPYCTAGIAHVGLDESFEIGRCPLCRREVEQVGLGRHFANHAIRLHEICRDFGLRMGMWADMLYYVPDAIAMLPKEVIGYDWFYYPFKKLPRIELYNFADVDLTGAMRKAGLDVYGCPNNGPFMHEPLTPFLDRLRNILSWWDYCRRKDAQGLLITSWSPTRAAIELNCHVDAAAASLWLNPGEREPRRMLELGFERVFGRKGRRFAALAAAAEKYQHTGYYRWQANNRWSSLATFEPLGPWRREQRHFRRIARPQAPVALRESLRMRAHVADRDLFIREGAALLAKARRQPRESKAALHHVEQKARALKKSLRIAEKATRTIWARSRYADDPNPNEATIQGDRKRIHSLLGFLQKASRNPRFVARSCPLLGEWQLLVRVRNVAPALQGVAVERRKADGSWETLHSLYSLEFSADAGQRRADFRRRHSVAIEWDGRNALALRVAVRGVGQLELHDLQLTDGVRVLRPARIAKGSGPVHRIARLASPRLPGSVLGVPAPHKGFPPIDWSANQAWADVTFSRDGRAAIRPTTPR